MLKIKEYRNVSDDGRTIRPEKIDLKELEKFGFVKIAGNLIQHYYKRGTTTIYCDCVFADNLFNKNREISFTREELNMHRKKMRIHTNI